MIGKMIKANNFDILKIMDKVRTVMNGTRDFIPCDRYMTMDVDGKVYKIAPDDVDQIFITDFNVRADYEYPMGDGALKLKYISRIDSKNWLFKNVHLGTDQIINEWYVHKLEKIIHV